jgi:hypothetical protein
LAGNVQKLGVTDEEALKLVKKILKMVEDMGDEDAVMPLDKVILSPDDGVADQFVEKDPSDKSKNSAHDPL